MNVSHTLNGYLLVEPKSVESILGIEIPDSVDKERPTTGLVVLGGQDKDGVVIQPGQIVTFHSMSPRPIVHGGKNCLLIDAEDVYAVIQE